MAFSAREKTMLSALNRLKGKGKPAVESLAAAVSSEGPQFKKFVFGTMFQNPDADQVEQMRRFLHAEAGTSEAAMHENLVNMLSAPENGTWLKGVLKHDHVVAGFELAGSNYLRGQVGTTLRKALKGRKGLGAGTPGHFEHPRVALANGVLAALNSIGLPTARPPTGRAPDAVEDPYAGLPDAAQRIAHEYLDDIRIPVMSLVQRGLHQYAIAKMSEPHRVQVEHIGRLPHYASHLMDTAMNFVNSLAGEGISRKNIDVDALVTHAWDSANYADFRQRMALLAKQGTKKIDAGAEGEPAFLKKFFVNKGSAFTPDGTEIAEDDISAHNISELRWKSSVGNDFHPWSPEQQSARAFYEMVHLAKVAGGTKPDTPRHLREYVRKAFDGHEAFLHDMNNLGRERRVPPQAARNMFVQLVMAHGPEEGQRLHEEITRRAAERRRR